MFEYLHLNIEKSRNTTRRLITDTHLAGDDVSDESLNSPSVRPFNGESLQTFRSNYPYRNRNETKWPNFSSENCFCDRIDNSTHIRARTHSRYMLYRNGISFFNILYVCTILFLPLGPSKRTPNMKLEVAPGEFSISLRAIEISIVYHPPRVICEKRRIKKNHIRSNGDNGASASTTSFEYIRWN